MIMIIISTALDVKERICAVLCFTKIAKRRITQTTVFDNARTLSLLMSKILVGETKQWSHSQLMARRAVPLR